MILPLIGAVAYPLVFAKNDGSGRVGRGSAMRGGLIGLVAAAAIGWLLPTVTQHSAALSVMRLSKSGDTFHATAMDEHGQVREYDVAQDHAIITASPDSIKMYECSETYKEGWQNNLFFKPFYTPHYEFAIPSSMLTQAVVPAGGGECILYDAQKAGTALAQR